jgi:transposase
MQIYDRTKVVFKDYNFNQNLLLPPSLEELIDPNHPVRVVNQVVDNLNLDPILSNYDGGGCPAYHPRMMLKVLVYGYMTNRYSSRKIEEALQQNIHFMWLSGMSYPDHNTINRFRSERLKGLLKEVFSQVVHLLIDHGHITLKEAYLDGTKIEANANRYTFVWGKSIKYHRERIKGQLEDLWRYAEQVAREELEHNHPESFAEIDAEKVAKTIEKIDQALSGKEVDKKVKQKLTYARKRWPESLKKYEKYEQQMGQRNSLSKTDPDATFMRMKEDHMLNGQLKPGYNWQVSTQNQYILEYTLHQSYYCPMGQRMELIKEAKRTTANGYQQNKKFYQAQNCQGCPMRGACHKQKVNRIIEVNPQLVRYKQMVREKLNSEVGLQYRSQRPVDVEAVFGNVKFNHGFKRFLLRGMEKVEIEAGLISLAQNLRKMAQ